APQAGQNRAPSGRSEPHTTQATPASYGVGPRPAHRPWAQRNSPIEPGQVWPRPGDAPETSGSTSGSGTQDEEMERALLAYAQRSAARVGAEWFAAEFARREELERLELEGAERRLPIVDAPGLSSVPEIALVDASVEDQVVGGAPTSLGIAPPPPDEEPEPEPQPPLKPQPPLEPQPPLQPEPPLEPQPPLEPEPEPEPPPVMRHPHVPRP